MQQYFTILSDSKQNTLRIEIPRDYMHLEYDELLSWAVHQSDEIYSSRGIWISPERLREKIIRLRNKHPSIAGTQTGLFR